jgi:hypothetical protein
LSLCEEVRIGNPSINPYHKFVTMHLYLDGIMNSPHPIRLKNATASARLTRPITTNQSFKVAPSPPRGHVVFHATAGVGCRAVVADSSEGSGSSNGSGGGSQAGYQPDAVTLLNGQQTAKSSLSWAAEYWGVIIVLAIMIRMLWVHVVSMAASPAQEGVMSLCFAVHVSDQACPFSQV